MTEPDAVRELLEMRLASRHDDELVDPWRDLKSEFLAQAG